MNIKDFLASWQKKVQKADWNILREDTKTINDTMNALTALGKAIKSNKPDLKECQPALANISSLFDVFETPLGVLMKDMIPFAPIALTFIKWTVEATKQDPSLELCVLLVSQAAYMESFQHIIKQASQLQEKHNQKDSISQDLAQKIKELAKRKFEEQDIKQSIVCFHTSKLAEAYNQILQKRLQEAGLTEEEAYILTQRVAWNTHRYMIQARIKLDETIKLVKPSYGDLVQAETNFQSIDDYLTEKIAKKPEEKIFEETNTNITFRDLYVPLQAKELNAEDNTGLQLVEEWVKAKLYYPEREQKKVLFIQGEAGRGKSVFCRMFADRVSRELHPFFTPVLIRLRELRQLDQNLANTLKNYLQNEGFAQRDNWITDKNTRFLFLLDGFDELLLQGLPGGGLENFLEWAEMFQKTSKHQLLITGRPLALEGINKQLSSIKNLQRVELQQMDDEIRDKWLEKWAAKVGETEAKEFKEFLQACPDEIQNNLAREPLLLYLLATMHRDDSLKLEMFKEAEGIEAKILIYKESVEWVLKVQRDDHNFRLTGLEAEALRQIITEAALCVVQSGNEYAKVAMLEARLKKGHSEAARLFQKSRRDNSEDNKDNSEDNKLNNLLTTFYIKPASGDKSGHVEFVHKSFSEFLFAERLINSFIQWIKPNFEGINQDIYDLLGYGSLTPEIVGYLRGLLGDKVSKFQDKELLYRLFQRLEEFYFNWCDGKFIDNELPNWRKEKLKMQLEGQETLEMQLEEQETPLGLRQMDVYTGLNVMILLLELHRYAKTKGYLPDKIKFYPCGEPDSDKFDAKRFRGVISYAQSLDINVFHYEFFSNLDLSRADLTDTNLRYANLSNANLSNADLHNTNLRYANLSNADLTNADLFYADLRDAELSYEDPTNGKILKANLSGVKNLQFANLSSAKLSHAELSSANLVLANLSSANLSSAELSSADLNSADLIFADLSSANLSSAELIFANLNSANLSSAELSSADLNSAKLSNADLEGVKWNSETKWLGARGLHKAKGVFPELEKDPGFSAARSLSEGLSLLQEGKVEEAKAAFKKALDL